mmetsp:Transcript_30102/g.51218  ORF Transcript_30102/g.51218 Transcript_30102/m.51218 type:complete len:106 (-) Transcript_30102:715-1032(-)
MRNMSDIIIDWIGLGTGKHPTSQSALKIRSFCTIVIVVRLEAFAVLSSNESSCVLLLPDNNKQIIPILDTDIEKPSENKPSYHYYNEALYPLLHYAPRSDCSFHS